MRLALITLVILLWVVFFVVHKRMTKDMFNVFSTLLLMATVVATLGVFYGNKNAIRLSLVFGFVWITAMIHVEDVYVHEVWISDMLFFLLLVTILVWFTIDSLKTSPTCKITI